VGLNLSLTSPPSNEPMTTAQAKVHLRVVDDEDDTYIGGIVTAARYHLETETRRQFITATYALKLDCFPGAVQPLHLPKPPLQSVSSVSYEDAAGATQTLSTGSYQVVTGTDPGYIIPEPGETWPVTETDREEAVTVTYIAGYGTSSTDMPDALIHANKLMVGQYYEFREPVVVGTNTAKLPMAVEALISDYKMIGAK
jgi:uncharacterized phiE125 gp8 family phage protein